MSILYFLLTLNQKINFFLFFFMTELLIIFIIEIIHFTILSQISEKALNLLDFMF